MGSQIPLALVPPEPLPDYKIIKQIDIFLFFKEYAMESPNVPLTILRTRFKTGN
jgi:hypothetical protein